jgi:hypothetical protein
MTPNDPARDDRGGDDRRAMQAQSEEAAVTAMMDIPEAPEASFSAVPARKRGGGPQTQEGKMASRGNAMKHGLRAKVLLPDDLVDAVAARTAEMTAQHAPANPYESWLVGEMANAAAKLQRSDELMIIDLERVIDRAHLCWEADRGKEADALGARLPKAPWRVARALARSRQGSDWMIMRWESLDAALRCNGGWDEAQRSLAFDLLAVDPELRLGSDRLPPEGDADALADLVAEQLESLRYVQEVSLVPLDRAEREMAAAGMPLTEDACTARLRRYEAAQRRALHWALAELRRVREGLPPSRMPAPGLVEAAPPSEPAPDASPPDHRPPTIESATDVQARQAEQVTMDMLLRSAEPAPVVKETPAIETPAALLRSRYAMTSAFASPAPENRRERLAQKANAQRAQGRTSP